MKNVQFLMMAVLLLTLTTLTSCQAIADIFKAGMGVGAFLVIAAVALVVFLVAKIAGGK